MSMQLTRACEYAIKSLLYLALQDPETRVMTSEVAIAQEIPVNFVRKILEALAKTGMVESHRGAGGGFTLARGPETITIRQIVEAVEGPLALNQCLSQNICENKPHCPMSEVWQEAQRAVESVLERYTLADIVHSINQRRQEGVTSAV